MSDHDATTGSSWCRGRSVLVTGAAGGMGAAIATAGLYAAGNVMGSPFGMTYGGPGGTLGPAMVYGFLGGRHAASRR